MFSHFTHSLTHSLTHSRILSLTIYISGFRGGGGAEGLQPSPPPLILEILKSYWEKGVFSRFHPPPHFESLCLGLKSIATTWNPSADGSRVLFCVHVFCLCGQQIWFLKYSRRYKDDIRYPFTYLELWNNRKIFPFYGKTNSSGTSKMW